MEKDGILCRKDPSGGRRGTRVLFSLSEFAKQKHNLGILRIDNVREKRIRLLRLLLCFHVYRRFPLLSESELSGFLRLIGNFSKNDLKEVDPKITSSISVPLNWLDDRTKVYEISNGIQVVEAKTLQGKTFYYPVIPGFSLEEFLIYIEDLIDMTDHRPFSNKTPFVPYLRLDDYTENEANDAIMYLLDANIIRHIHPIFHDEDRFDIISEELKDLAYEIWSIYQIDIHSLLGKIMFVEKPSERDKEYLSLHFGPMATDKVILVGAHDYRRGLKKGEKTIDKKRKNFFSKDLPKSRAKMVEELLEKYKKLVEDTTITPLQRVVHELVYDILYPTPVYRI